MKTTKIDGEELVVRLAMQQHGAVTRQQLLVAGISVNSVDRYIATRRLRPVHRGVYVLGSLRGALEPERAREMAAVLACGPGAVLSHGSAGRLWGILPGKRRRGPGSRLPAGGDATACAAVDVTIPGRARRRRPGICIHRSKDLPHDELTRLDGIPITGPGRTLRDLSAVLTVRGLSRAAARAEREGLVDPTSLPDLVADHGRQRGAPALRAALLGDGPVFTRSEAEERLLALLREAGLPRPQVNVMVEGYEVDFFWPAAGMVVEVDGFAFHSSRGSFEGDRRRDIDLESKGIGVVRVTWRQIVGERTATAARIAGALGHAAARAR